MKIEPFSLERYFARYEFSAPHLLCCSDCEPLTKKELLAMADDELLTLWDELWLGYTESQGHPLLREEAARFYRRITPEQVLIVTPEEGIWIAMNTILEKGDHVIVTFPGYQSSYEIAKSLGCEVTNWMPAEQAGWKFDLESLRRSIKPNTKMIAVNFPHNPTGSLISKTDFEEIIRIARERNIILFSDEMYRCLEYAEADRLPSACDLYENAVSLFGVSKTFALAGLRIGWVVTRNREIFSRMVAFRDYTTICSSAPSEVLAVMALRAKEKIILRNLEIIQKNLAILDDFFNNHSAQMAWIKPKAGTIGFPRLLTHHNVTDFCADLTEKKGVMLLPSSVYNYDGNHFRIGFGRKNMPEALAKLGEYLDECAA